MMQATSGAYHGLYINLDRSPNRRAKFETQLAELGLASRYTRFAAVDGRALNVPESAPLGAGEVGVFLSNYRALEAARMFGKCVHVVEDDALLSIHVPSVIEDAISSGYFDHYDLLFTDMMVHANLGFLKSMKEPMNRIAMPPKRPLRLAELNVVDLSQYFFAAFQSYIVGVKSIDKVLALYKQEIAGGLKMPVDIFVQQQVLAGKLRASCITPFITSFRLDDHVATTIGEAAIKADPSVMVMAILRYSFFLGRDMDYAKRMMDAATKTNRKPTDAHHALILQALEFVLSDDFSEGG